MIKYSLHINKNIWHVSFYITDTNGKKKQKCLSTHVKANNSKGNLIGGSKKKADLKAQEIVSEYEGTTYSEYSEMNLAEYVADWVERDKNKISNTTYDKYKSMLNKHIRPYFTTLGLNIKKIKPMHLERYVNDKLEEGLSSNTILKHIGIIRPALYDAMKNGYIRTNPAELMDKPKKKKVAKAFISPEKLNKYLLAVKGSEIEVPILLSVAFGLRRSEVLGLTWSAIDFEKRTLEISHKAITAKGKDGKTTTIITDELKTEASHDSYYLNDTVYNYLKQLKGEQAEYIRETKDYIDFVCVNKVGALLKPDYITSKFSKIQKAHGLDHIRLHDLRHCAISILANDASFTMKQVQGYARHANYATTADIYSHNDDSVKLVELDAITSLFKDSFAV